MDCSALCQALLSTQSTALPSPGITHVSLHVGWAVVLAALALRITGVPWPLRRALGGMVAAWTLLPGALSPAYWLGLAFQAPSLALLLVAAVSLFIAYRSGPVSKAATETGARDCAEAKPVGIAPTGRAVDVAAITGIVLGWLLLLDTFALLPFPLYAIGFSTAAVAVVAIAVFLPWIVVGAREGGATVALAGAVITAVFVATRLPTGNLWDALLDPLLWLALQVGWLVRVLRRLRPRGPAATRA